LRIIIAAGASGGHIFPAIALAHELMREPGTTVIFAASKRGIDKQILRDTGLKKYFFSINPMPYRINTRSLPFIGKMIMDTVLSLYVLIRERPAAVVGFGGYTSGALILLASLFRIRTIIHEQNVVPGRANLFLDRIVTRVAVTFDETKKYLKNRNIIVTGNPLREDIILRRSSSGAGTPAKKDGRLTILVMGGSQGARSLNALVSEALGAMDQSIIGRIDVLHIAGAVDAAPLGEKYRLKKISAKTFSFVDNIHDLYEACDMAITRSGAAAVFELALYGKPMILVPYPFKKNSQRLNARYFCERGAALCAEEKEVTVNELALMIQRLISDDKARERLSNAAKRLARPDAARCLAKAVSELR